MQWMMKWPAFAASAKTSTGGGKLAGRDWLGKAMGLGQRHTIVTLSSKVLYLIPLIYIYMYQSETVGFLRSMVRPVLEAFLKCAQDGPCEAAKACR